MCQKSWARKAGKINGSDQSKFHSFDQIAASYSRTAWIFCMRTALCRVQSIKQSQWHPGTLFGESRWFPGKSVIKGSFGWCTFVHDESAPHYNDLSVEIKTSLSITNTWKNWDVISHKCKWARNWSLSRRLSDVKGRNRTYFNWTISVFVCVNKLLKDCVKNLTENIKIWLI